MYSSNMYSFEETARSQLDIRSRFNKGKFDKLHMITFFGGSANDRALFSVEYWRTFYAALKITEDG